MLMTEGGVLYYGQDKIHYEILRQPKVSRSDANKIKVKVHPDRRVVAVAPFDATDELIHEAMNKRIRWIWQNLQAFIKQSDHVLPKRYVSGETQFYLGRRYVLKVIESSDDRGFVKLNRGKLTVSLPSNDNQNTELRMAQIKKMIDQWYQDKAQIVFTERFNIMLSKASWVASTPTFKMMTMTKQWGSCSVKGKILLNPHLIKAPKECIDYVILHELCHIAEHNHSERFWRLLTQVMPNWKEVKARLDGMAESYLNE